jgi:bacterioferritin-associated ferredoxin
MKPVANNPFCGFGAVGEPGSMIVCSCNVLTDHEVRSAVTTSAPRTTGQVYGCLGCSAQCGRCARSIRKIMDEALLGAGCPVGCGSCATHKHD